MNFKKPPGIEDVFPDRIPLWNTITQTARKVFHMIENIGGKA